MLPALRCFHTVTLALLLRAHSYASTRRDVLELTDADFDYLCSEHETMLIMFYAPWCAHCKKLKPEFEKAAARLKGGVTLAQVDCTAHTHTCSRFSVSGFPALRIFRYGRDSAPYEGSRSAEGMYQVMRTQTGPDSAHLRSRDDLRVFVSSYEASVVGVFPRGDGPSLSEFLEAAALLRDRFRFSHVTDLHVIEEHAQDQCVLLFRPPRLWNRFEENMVVYRDQLTPTALRRFIRDNISGLCPHMTLENHQRLRVSDLLTAFYDVDYHHNTAGSNYWRNRVMKVVSQYSGRGLTFSVANKKDFLSELEDCGVGMSEGGGVYVTIRTREGSKFTMREEFTADGASLQRFLDDYFSGKLKPYVKSEPLPENNHGAVKVLVGEWFVEQVKDSLSDVLVLFFSPSCDQCRRLLPLYEQLATQLHSVSNIVVAQMNGVDNDLPIGYHVQGFPTIYFIPVGKKDEPIRFQGDWTLRDLIGFLRRHSTHSVVLKDEL